MSIGWIGVYEQVRLVNLVDAKEADIPKWLPQASKIIDNNAAGNKVAKDFLDFSVKAVKRTQPEATKEPGN